MLVALAASTSFQLKQNNQTDCAIFFQALSHDHENIRDMFIERMHLTIGIHNT